MKSLALSIAYLLTAVVSSTFVYPLTTDVIDLQRGEKLFQQRCASCHSFQPNETSFGPNLSTLNERASNAFPALRVEEYVLESILKPSARSSSSVSQKMPADTVSGLNRSQIMDIVAYTLGQSGSVDYAFLHSLPIAPEELKELERVYQVDVQTADLGLQLYLKKYSCVVCHPLDGSSGAGLLAPDLTGAGLHSETHLRESILTPNKSVSPAYHQSFLVADGRQYIGKVVSESDDEIALLCMGTEEGKIVRSFGREQLDLISDDQCVIPYEKSLMPDYSEFMTDDDLEAILQFLKTLR
jgi:putative heme-binding domain-containing protein